MEPKLYRGRAKKDSNPKHGPLLLGFEARDGTRATKRRKKNELSPDELEEILRCLRKEGLTQR